MNERVMQFRIGMFVIVAGLVLTMLIIWFGESPALLRDQTYLRVHFTEAPGVSEGIPVRKSGIRIGEVAAVAFDERPNQPEGVIVTLAIERRYEVKQGAVPRISRALIGDVSIDMLPGKGTEPIPRTKDPTKAPIIEGAVAADPANALIAATATLDAIKAAANNISHVAEKAQGLDEFLTTWKDAGQKFAAASDDLHHFIKTNEGEFQPAVAQFRQFAEKANTTFDPDTQAKLKAAIDRFSTASARFDQGLAALQPLLKDLGAMVGTPQTTNFGQAMMRFNKVMYDLSILTKALHDGQGNLSSKGSLQRLVSRSDLYDNLNNMSNSVGHFFSQANKAVGYLNEFAQKIARDPSALTRGALRSP
jgi:phospholipid/cholesterol/gamma-HCH transport system substrate-binding protein